MPGLESSAHSIAGKPKFCNVSTAFSSDSTHCPEVLVFVIFHEGQESVRLTSIEQWL